jgi:ATP-dependent DNA helicase RecQ
MLEEAGGDETHRRAAQQRLNAMLGLCEISSCRRRALLRHFGETLDEDCGNCDTCLEPVDTWDGSEAARMALSAAYRTGQRFGVNHLIDVLRGAATERVAQFGHDRLPVYGIGADRDAAAWRSVFRQLIARGLLRVDLDQYGGLRLEEACRPLLRGDAQIELRRDRRHVPVAVRGSAREAPGQVDPQLWQALRDCRQRLATEQGVPPYVIFHDSTLRAMCEARPRSLAEFAQLSGVGTRKLERYGETFLAVLGEYDAEPAAP